MPAVLTRVGSSRNNSSQNGGSGARVLSGALTGFMEISLFHPVDTAAKRLICHQGVSGASVGAEHQPSSASAPSRTSWIGGRRPRPIEGMQVRSATTLAAEHLNRRSAQIVMMEQLQTFHSSLNIALGADGCKATRAQKMRSMYRGLHFAYFYKTVQRGFQYSAQPFIANWLSVRHRSSFERTFSGRLAQPAEHAFAGCIMGCSEIMFLPIDSLKVKSQTGVSLPSAVAWRATLAHLYRAAGWTAARNGVGAFTLFGGAAFTKEHVMGLKEYRQASPWQHFASSTVAAVLSICASSPLDVIKTRVQRQGVEAGRGQGGFQIAQELIRNEGKAAFYKGIVPKCSVTAPKLIFAYTCSNWLYQKLSDA